MNIQATGKCPSNKDMRSVWWTTRSIGRNNSPMTTSMPAVTSIAAATTTTATTTTSATVGNAMVTSTAGTAAVTPSTTRSTSSTPQLILGVRNMINPSHRRCQVLFSSRLYIDVAGSASSVYLENRLVLLTDWLLGREIYLGAGPLPPLFNLFSAFHLCSPEPTQNQK